MKISLRQRIMISIYPSRIVAAIVKRKDTRNLAYLQRDTPARFRAMATTETPGLMAAQINLANLMP